MSLFEVSSSWLDERYARCYVWAATPERARELGKVHFDRVWNLRATTILQVVLVFPLRQHEDYPLIMDAAPEQKTERSDYEAFCAFFGVMGVKFQARERSLGDWAPNADCALDVTAGQAYFWFDREGAYLGVDDDEGSGWTPRQGEGT